MIDNRAESFCQAEIRFNNLNTSTPLRHKSHFLHHQIDQQPTHSNFPTMSVPLPPLLQDSITLAQRYTSPWFYLSRPIPPPSSPYTISLNRKLYARKYHLFNQRRDSKLFRLRDSPLASIFRMYEMLLCRMNESLAAEAEYFWTRHWQTRTIPNPSDHGCERDLDRDRLCEIIVICLVEPFNSRIPRSSETRRPCIWPAAIQQELPQWAQSLDTQSLAFKEVYHRFPGLAKLFFFLPSKSLLMLHPPSNPSVIYSRHDVFRSNYLFLPRLHSFPMFRRQDTLLSSFCRVYEIRVLMRLVPEMQDVYDLEERYFWNRWSGTSVHEVPDPRTR
jgi:hypothetical protein